MPTEPLKGLLDRDLSKAMAKDLIDVACPLLQELVNYATNAWRRCETSMSKAENENLAAVFLYLHIIEMTDGIEALLRGSCCVPAMPLVRSSFEGLVSIEYILESPSKYVQRSLSWLAGYAHERLKKHRGLDPSTQRGKELWQEIQSDPTLSRTLKAMPTKAQAQQIQQPLTKLLNRPQFASIEAEYTRLKKKSKREPAWYHLFDGPASLESLCIHLGHGRLVMYELLYRHWSSIVHAGDLSRFITRTATGERAIWSLRNARDFQMVALSAATFILEATEKMLRNFRPTESIAQWCLSEIRERYLWLAQSEISIKEIV